MTLGVANGAAADDVRVELDLTDAARRLPHGQQAQIRLLERQLVWCRTAVLDGQRRTAAAMRDDRLGDAERWEAVRALRALAWKVCREVLPLVGRVPANLRAHPDFLEVERACHELRRTTEDALRDNANHTVDLVTATTQHDLVVRS